MPAQKRSLPENFHTEGGESSQHHNRHPRRSRHEREPHQDKDDEETEDELQPEDQPQQERDPDDVDAADQAAEEEDSEYRSSSSDSEEKTEYVFVELSEIRKDVQCPICLGIIKKTRTVMECLHRFCRECIDKSMRLGNNECPACRTHCASRRSLRDDPNYDAFIAALYPDIEKYEEEELAFHEEERNRNKQIQASIAQISQRQSEALIKRRTQGKDTGGFMPRPQRNPRSANSKRRRSSRGREVHVSDDNEDENNGGKDDSSNDERSREISQKRCKKKRSSQASSSAVNSDGGCTGNDQETKRENRGISPSLVWSPEMLAWGRGGARSHTRHGNNSSNNSKTSRGSRITKLADYLQGLNANKKEEGLHLILIPLDENSTPVLQQPHIYCQPNLSVKSLCDYVALNTALRSDEVEISVVKSPVIPSAIENGVTPLPMVVPQENELQALGEQGTLAEIGTSGDHLLLAYRRKKPTEY